MISRISVVLSCLINTPGIQIRRCPLFHFLQYGEEQRFFFLIQFSCDIPAPLSQNLTYYRISCRSLFRGKDRDDPPVLLLMLSSDKAAFFQLCQLAGHIAFMDTDLSCQTLLRYSRFSADMENIAVLTSCQSQLSQAIRSRSFRFVACATIRLSHIFLYL